MKALASRKRSCPTSVRSFFCVRGRLAQASELVGDGDELLGQFFKTSVIGHQRFDLRGLLGGHPLGELLALDIALEEVIGTLGGLGVGAAFLEELSAEGAAAEPVDGLDLLEDLLAALLELGERKVHDAYCIYIDTISQPKNKTLRAPLKIRLLLCLTSNLRGAAKKFSEYFFLNPSKFLSRPGPDFFIKCHLLEF